MVLLKLLKIHCGIIVQNSGIESWVGRVHPYYVVIVYWIVMKNKSSELTRLIESNPNSI